MAGETVKTKGIVLSIRPWSRTSHVVTWLTSEQGVVTTVVKGAVRPKSAFLGQYDLFYTCELVYYARSRSGMHAIREVSPLDMREYLRSDWRAASLAGYGADILKDQAGVGEESGRWFLFFGGFLDSLENVGNYLAMLVRLEKSILRLAGLEPDFSCMDESCEWSYFSVEYGKCSDVGRSVRITPGMVDALKFPMKAQSGDLLSAIRFLGVFISFHLDRSPGVRRSIVQMLSSV